jgi:AraC-like DNA-binding protein
MRPLQQITMNEARDLLTFSGLNVSATASYLDYPRINEFSREFSKYFGYPPSLRTLNLQLSLAKPK